MAFKMRTGTASEFGNGANMSEGEIVNVKSGLATENGGAMFYAPRDGVPERVVTDVDQTVESNINFTGTLSKNGTPLTPTAAEINRLSGVTDNIQNQINDANDDISTLQSRATRVNLTVTAGTNVTLGTNKACIIDGFIYLSVKGRANAAITNAVVATISGDKNFISPTTIPIGIGGEWTITSTGYGFINGQSLTATVPNGSWFHLVATIPYA